MRMLSLAILFVGLGVAATGCGPRKSFEGPTIDGFEVRVLHQGQPVTFPQGSEASLKLFHEKGESFEIPLQPDGSFTRIKWMPIGRFSATLLRPNKTGVGPAETRYGISAGLTIEAGKTRYEIELGPEWKP